MEEAASPIPQNIRCSPPPSGAGVLPSLFCREARRQRRTPRPKPRGSPFYFLRREARARSAQNTSSAILPHLANRDHTELRTLKMEVDIC